MGDTVAVRICGRCSNSSALCAGLFFKRIVWHLLGKRGGWCLATGFIDEEVVDVLGSVRIFDVFRDIFGSGQFPSVFKHVGIAIDCWCCGIVISCLVQSLSSVTAFFRALNRDGFGSIDLNRKVKCSSFTVVWLPHVISSFHDFHIVDKDNTPATEVYSWAEVPLFVINIFDFEGPYVGKVVPTATVAHASVVEATEACIVDVAVARGISECIYTSLETSRVVVVCESISVAPRLVREVS
jgi:hypothetical protein